MYFYRHLDCAHYYQNEQQIGSSIKKAMNDFNISRNQLFITTKLWNTFHQPKDVEPAFRQSLKDLGLAYIDLYLIHWPVALEPGNNLLLTGRDRKTKVK
jgi:diketogulonate reductase-like aldo/keto reductase